MARDNFTKLVIEKLKERVALRCSNPKCRVPTSAPSGADKVTSVGVAAHICAASPKGPRPDADMTPAERKGIDNGIWLCYNCSVDIDRDENRYTVSCLKEWKKVAESTARKELGKKIPSDTDAIDTISSALTGLPTSFVKNAIANVHQASEKSLESIDPRIVVKTTHASNLTSFYLYPKENIPLKFTIGGEGLKGYKGMYQKLLEHGADLKVQSEDITISGSKLLEEMAGNIDGTVSFLPEKKQAAQKLWLVQEETGAIEIFDDIQGAVTNGTKSFTFEGTACNKLFKLRCQTFFDNIDNGASLTITLCMDEWESLSLIGLPYFDKILSLFSKMAQGWMFFTSLEITGLEIFSSEGMKLDNVDYILSTSNFLHYTHCCRVISSKLHQKIQFTSSVSYTGVEHQNITEIAEIFEGKQEYDENSPIRNIMSEVTIDNDCESRDIFVEPISPACMQCVTQVGDIVTIFGVDISLPSKTISLNPVLPKVHGSVNKLKAGDIVTIEWIPQKGFRGSISFDV